MKKNCLLFIILNIGFLSRLVLASECQNYLPESEMTFKNKIALYGTVDRGELSEEILPRGSAILTSSGVLSRSQITAVIHAASGSMMRSGENYEPSLDSIRSSIYNSVVLAVINNHEAVVIPMVGGGIFLNRVGISIEKLALAIIEAAVDAKKNMDSNINLKFIGIGESDSGAFSQALLELQKSNSNISSIEVIKGSITDFNSHRSTAIVNAANTEVVFGGGISGAIGRATEDARAIEEEAKKLILGLANR